MSEATTHGSPVSTPPARGGRTGLVMGLLVGAALLAGAVAMWRHDTLYPSTDDASLQAHYVWVSAQVPGQVLEKFVRQNQFVKAGDPLFQIDPRPYQDALSQAQAEVVTTNSNITADLSQIQSLQDLIKAQQAAINVTQQQYDDLKPLLQQEYAAKIQGIQVQGTLLEQQAKLLSLQAQLTETQARSGDPTVQAARRQQAAAAATTAQVNLSWTTVRAPADGYVTQLNLRVGDIVQPGQPLFPFIESRQWWITANFKETNMDRIQPGHPVTFTVDMYDGQTFTGVVHSISRGVASSFSLLPPQNTTGNWVKVTQRVPVRILVNERPEFPFRLGASVEATIDTSVPPGPVPEEQPLPAPAAIK